MSQEEAEWEWQPSNSVLIVNEDQKLQLLEQPLTFGNEKYNIHFSAKEWKPFHYCASIGWNWHKSWNMPEIECSVKIIDQVHQAVLKQVCLQATCYVAKTNYQTMTLQNVGVRGCDEYSMLNGVCVFKSLKFNTTSYKNECQKFQLVIVLSQLVDNQMQVLSSVTSPCIFVDSRKHARIEAASISIQLIVDPFLPENLEKPFIKRRKKNQPNSSQEITPDTFGFVNYFTAQNIRHKIKHPLFLAIRFHECVKLYLNQDISENQVINEVQKILMQKTSQQIRSDKQMALLIVIPDGCDIELQNKLQCIICQMENKYFSIYLDQALIAEDLVEVKNINALQQKYKQMYPNLIKSKYGIDCSEKNVSTDQKEDQTSLKIIKVEKQDQQFQSPAKVESINSQYLQFQQQYIWQQNLQYQREQMFYSISKMPQYYYYPYYY